MGGVSSDAGMGGSRIVEEDGLGMTAEKEKQNSRPMSKWDKYLEMVRNLSPEERKQFRARQREHGRRQAHAILGNPGKPTMTREELREYIAKKYPRLTLSDQIIEDRKAGL